jgi:uncharacterized protein YndB with AHSA1/START domain
MSDSVTRETVLDLDLDEAWRAVTEPGELEQWLADDVEIEPVEGGDLRVRFGDGGERAGTVEVVAEPSRVVWRWHPVGDPDLTTTVSIDLEPDPAGTRIRIVESGFDSLPLAGRSACALLGGWAWEGRLEARARAVAA